MAQWYWKIDISGEWYPMDDAMNDAVEKAFKGNNNLIHDGFAFAFPLMICVGNNKTERLICRVDHSPKNLPWLYEDEFGKYNFMESDLTSTLCIARKYHTAIQIHIPYVSNVSYRFDLVNMTQSNMITGKTRNIVPAPLMTKNTFIDSAPPEYVCPIAFCLMEDPVIAADGHTYERSAIEKWFVSGRLKNKQVISPNTNEPMLTARLYPNLSMKAQVNRWLEDYKKVVEPKKKRKK